MIKNILSEQEICTKFGVTAEEIDRASRVIDMKTGEIFYQVSSRSGGEDHEVRYNSEFNVLTCTCKAGQAGVGCWAKRAARAAAYEARQYERVALEKEAEAARVAALNRAQVEAQAVIDARMTALYAQRDTVSAQAGFSLLK